jgi:hypothetical protein
LSRFFCIFAANLRNKNNKSIKPIKYIIVGALVLLLFSYLLPTILLSIPSIQQKITDLAEEELHNKLGTDVYIGSVEFELFSKIVLKEVNLCDQSGAMLFNAQRLSAGFNLLPLLHGRLVFSSAQLFSFQLDLRKETPDSPLNIQFIIDAFASKDSTEKSGIDLHIHTLNIRRGKFSYHVASEMPTPGVFNAKHLDISNISAKIKISELSKDTLAATFNNLSLKTQSGPEIKRLSFSVNGSAKQLSIHPFELWLPNSRLKIDNFQAVFPEKGKADQLLSQTEISLQIVHAEITPQDIGTVIPALANFQEKISLKGKIHGTYDKLYLSDVQVNSDNMALTSNLSLYNLSMPDSTYIDGDINRFYITSQGIQKIINEQGTVSKNTAYSIKQLVQTDFRGHISGYFRQLTISGIFSTTCGNLDVDVIAGKNKFDRFFLQGHIQSSELDIHKLFPEENPYGKIVFDVIVDARQDVNKKPAGTINANISQLEFSRHTYENIRFKGDFTPSGFNGKVEIDDSFGKLFAEGLFKIDGNISEFNFRANAERIQLDKLNLSKKYPNSELSLTVDANFTGNTLENTEGTISIQHFSFQVPDDTLLLDSIIVNASGRGENRKISVQSDIASLQLLGAYSYRQLIPAVKQTMYRYIPAVIPPPQQMILDENNFYLDVTVENTEKLSKILQLPFTVFSHSDLHGQYNHTKGSFDFYAHFPRLNWGNMKMEEITLTLNNSQEMANLSLKGIRSGKFDVKTDFEMRLNAGNNELKSFVEWKNREESLYQGKLSALAKFIPSHQQSQRKVSIDLFPTQVFFNNNAWEISPANFEIAGSEITVNHLDIAHADQFIKIDGCISKDTANFLYADLNKINLADVFDALAIPSLDFGGIATGKVILNDLYLNRKLTANLAIKSFSFNEAVMGDLELDAHWNNEKQGIAMDGKARQNDTTLIDVGGMIYPLHEELSIHFDTHNANAAFLRKYLDNVTSGFSGKITGDIHLFGDFKNVDIEGNVFVREGQFGINFLNTVYNFSDSVYCSKGHIAIKNTALYDVYGNKAIANGAVRHQNFKDFSYLANIYANNFHVFNATERLNPTFFGTAFGTGNIKLSGNDDNINIDVNIQTNQHTKMSLNFNDKSNIEDYNFITFVSKNKGLPEGAAGLEMNNQPLNAPSSQTNIKLNLLLDVTPNAMLELHIDPTSGDKIKAWGRGNMQIQYGSMMPPRIYGNYSLERGTYNFSLQQVIYKDFHIKEGSAISFRGDPYLANLDINATHSVSANLGDLDQSFSGEQKTSMNSVMVDCLLKINGELQHPSIKFDLNLPNSSNELERQVKSIVGTEELMNRQIIFLLALGRFYTENNQYGNSNNDIANVASSTISTQLTSLLGPLSEHLQIGTNIRTSNYEEYSDTEFKVLLSSQLLNNRLLINGNLGYKDKTSEQSSFVGDFDLEYKLSASGNIRLKAYNHYNDKYYYVKSALTTQGVGILFRRDFDGMYDFFKTKKKTYMELQNNVIDYGEDEIFYR